MQATAEAVAYRHKCKKTLEKNRKCLNAFYENNNGLQRKKLKKYDISHHRHCHTHHSTLIENKKK